MLPSPPIVPPPRFDLPEELVATILDHFKPGAESEGLLEDAEKQEDLYQCALVCKQWRRILMPTIQAPPHLAFRDLHEDSNIKPVINGRLLALSRQIKADERLQKSKTFGLVGRAIPSMGPVRCSISDGAAFFRLCPNIVQISISGLSVDLTQLTMLENLQTLLLHKVHLYTAHPTTTFTFNTLQYLAVQECRYGGSREFGTASDENSDLIEVHAQTPRLLGMSADIDKEEHHPNDFWKPEEHTTELRSLYLSFPSPISALEIATAPWMANLVNLAVHLPELDPIRNPVGWRIGLEKIETLTVIKEENYDDAFIPTSLPEDPWKTILLPLLPALSAGSTLILITKTDDDIPEIFDRVCKRLEIDIYWDDRFDLIRFWEMEEQGEADSFYFRSEKAIDL